MHDEDTSIQEYTNEKTLASIKELLSDKRIQERKQLFAGKKVLLCGPGKNGDCNSICIELNINDRCGYHKRKGLQEQLYTNVQIVGIVPDDLMDTNDDIIKFEKHIIESEKIDSIVIFPDAPGSQTEFREFSKDPNLNGKIILFVKDKFFPFYGIEGIFTIEIKDFMFKNRGHVIIVKNDKNIYKLIEAVLLFYFRHN